MSAIPSPTAMASSGSIEALESRIKQLEGMLRAVEGKSAAKEASATAAPATSFRSFLSAPSSIPSTVAQGTGLRLSSTGLSGDMQSRADAFQPMIEEASQKYGVDKALINAVIQQESGFNPIARSKAGAQGLMQLMPSTAQGLGVTNPTDPVQNLDGGVRHLKSLLQTYNGNIPLALAAYNAGGGAVKKYGGVPPYQETQNYVRNILGMYLKQKQSAS